MADYIRGEYADLSVVLPTYQGDVPGELMQAIESVANQTIIPKELYIVKDGPLTDELELVIEKKSTEFPTTIQTHQIDENNGLGNALRVGVKNCSYSLVARMDADDISVPSRFEQQLEFLSENSNVHVVGGYIEEFDSDPDYPIARREVPTTHEEIKQMARFRNPMNHGTVMFKKETVLDAGNYRKVDRMEDYDLWVRMLLDGAVFANIPTVLAKVRAGEEMYARRGGWEYAREEIRIQVDFYKWGLTSTPVFMFNILTRTTLRFIPNRIRGIIYKIFARD